MLLDETISNGTLQFQSLRATTSMPLLLFKIQYRTIFLVLHTLHVVAYWIIYSEKANFVLDRKKYIMCKECGYLLPWGIERCRRI